MPVDKKVKIVKVLDPDTFLVQESGKSTGTPYKVRLTDSRNPNVWVDALEKDQYGYQESSMLKGLEGTEVTMKDFGKLDAYKRPIVGFSVNGKDLSEELFKTNAVYTRKPGESDYAFPPNNNPLDSAITPAAFKSLKKIKKGEMTDAKEMYAAHKAVNTIYNRYPNINASNVDAFVDRQQKKYENKETFQYRKPETPSSTMATPTANPAKPLARPTVQRLSTEQGIQALSGELIDNYEEIRVGLGEKMQDVRGWELHTKGDKKYLYPLLKGDTLNEWKSTLAEGTKSGQAETSFAGNSYATGKQAVENWKRTYSENKGTTSATGVTSGVKGKVAEGIENVGNPMMDYTKPVTQGTYTGVEKNTSFLTKNLISQKEGDSEFKIEDEGGKSIDGFKLASSLFLNLGAAFNPEPFTSGAMNTVGNKLYRDATNTKFSDAPVLNTLDELLGYSGAIGYLGATAPVGAVLEGGSTAMSTAKIAKITAKMTSLMKNAKNSKALTGSLTAAALSLGGKEAYNAVVSAGEKYGVNTPEFWKEVGVSAVPLIVGGFAMKKNFRNGKAAGLKTTRSLRTDFPKVTPVTPSKRYVNGVLKTPTILQSKLPFTRQLPNSSGTVFNKTFYDKAIKTNAGGFKNVKPKPATNWTTASEMKFKQGGTLKFQRGGGIPKFQFGTNGNIPSWTTRTPFKQDWSLENKLDIIKTKRDNYKSITDPTYGINNYLQYPTLKPNGTKYTYNLQKDLNKRFNAGLVQDGVYGVKTIRAQGFANSINHSPLPTEPSNIPEEKAVGYDGVEYGEASRLAAIDGISSQHWKGGDGNGSGGASNGAGVNSNNYKQRSQFGYQEANLALSTLASLLPTKVKNERLPFQEYNPYIRGIQGDPLHQQRMNTIAQNRFLRSKSTSSDPTRELVRGLVGNRQTDQATQDAYNIDTQARVTDTQRYYGEKNAANQFNYTNKLNVDSKNVEMANASRTQNAALRNQMLGQLLQNSQAYVTDKGNDARLVKQNYLVHKQKEREQTRNLLASDYARRWDLATTEEEKRALMREYNQKDAELQGGADEFYRSQGYNFNKRGGILTYKRGGTISDSVKMYAVDSKRSGEQDKLFVQTAYKYRELASKVSTAALNRGMKQVELAFKTIPQSKLQGLTFKKLF